MCFQRPFAGSSCRVTVCSKKHFEQKVKIAPDFCVCSFFILFLFLIVYIFVTSFLLISHSHNRVFTALTPPRLKRSHDGHVQGAQISTSIFYVCTFCTNFHFLSGFLPFYAYFCHFLPFITVFPLSSCI